MAPRWLKNILIKLGLQRPPLPDKRVLPVGPFSKSEFVSEPWTLNQLYLQNEIHTSRYTWYFFIFQNLQEQAQRIANFYFTCIAIIQLFIESAVSPVTSILPLVFVVGLSMVKQGYEDYLRHKADREVNNACVQLISENGSLMSKRAHEITVGDIVLIRAGDTFPCDLVLLSSSEPTGECFVTTASLDGETNLKRFVSISATKEMSTPKEIAENIAGSITCQQPIADFYKFFGTISTRNRLSEQEFTQPLGPESLLLRGARLKNTDFVYGCAVYTGEDTKMSLNSKGKQTKYSQIERKLNVYLLVYLIALTSTCIIFTILKFTTAQKVWYFSDRQITTWNVVQDFFAFVILLNAVIPISLYVTIELQKFFGTIFFGWDIEIYDSEIDQPALANTSDIPEELGQVSNII